MSVKPHLLTLPHTPHGDDRRVCIFVKDPQRAFKDEIADLAIPNIAKVIGFKKVQKNYKEYKDRRGLLNGYDAFLADLRVYKMLPPVLGREFYATKKYPAPVKVHALKPKALQKALNTAACATQFMAGNGPNYSVKIGH